MRTADQRDADRRKAVRRLYPELSEEQVDEVAETLRRYLEIIGEIHERVRQNSEANVAQQQKLRDCSLRDDGAGANTSKPDDYHNPHPAISTNTNIPCL